MLKWLGDVAIMPFDKPSERSFWTVPPLCLDILSSLRMAKRARRTTSEKRRDRIARLESEVVALREAKAFMADRPNTLRDELAILQALEDKKRS
jgi:hypothetical protein